MKKMRMTTLLIVLSAGFALLAAVAAETALKRQTEAIQEQEKTTTVAVAATSIPAHATITSGMVKLVAIPAGGVIAGAYRSVQPVIGKLATQAIYPGEQLLPPFFTSRVTSSDFADRIPSGMVAISVLYNPVYAVGGKIKAGDHVDVISVLNKGFNKTKFDASTIIAKNILVLSVPNLSSSNSSSASTSGSGQSISLAVSPQAANQIAFTAVYGQIYFVLEPSGGMLQSMPPVVTDSTIE